MLAMSIPFWLLQRTENPAFENLNDRVIGAR